MLAEFLTNVLGTTAASSLVLLGLAWLFRTWITERLKNSVKHEYDREIEAYRSTLALVQSATAKGQKAAIEARIQAFDRLWRALLAVRDNTGAITTFLDILTADEYSRLKDHSDFQNLVGGLNQERVQAMIPDSSIEEVRAYVGEYLWALFFAYQAVHLRIVILAWSSATEDHKKIYWQKDPGIRQLLSVILSTEELEQFDDTDLGKIALFRRLAESKVLAELRRLLSGQAAGDEAMKQGQRILAAAAEVKAYG